MSRHSKNSGGMEPAVRSVNLDDAYWVKNKVCGANDPPPDVQRARWRSLIRWAS